MRSGIGLGIGASEERLASMSSKGVIGVGVLLVEGAVRVFSCPVVCCVCAVFSEYT